MRKQVTNEVLWRMEMNITEFVTQNPGVSFLLRSSVDRFFQRNGTNLKAMHDRLHKIQKKYIVHNEEDVPQYANEEKTEWVYQESVVGKAGELLTGDAVKAAYQEESSELFGRSVTVEI